MMFLKSLKCFGIGKFRDRQESTDTSLNRSESKNKSQVLPPPVDRMIDNVIGTMSLGEKVTWANLDEAALFQLQLSLGIIIREQLERVSKNIDLNEFQAADLIIKELWKRLREKYRLKGLK